MSVPAAAIAVGGLAASAAINLVTIRTQRTLTSPDTGDLIKIMAAVREEATHELEVTQHPVEQGTQIADHAFVKPTKLVLRWCWSDSPTSSLLGLDAADGGDGYSKQIYEKLLAIQRARTLISVQTGKKLYDNLLMTLLSVPTDPDSEYSLMATIHCQEVLIANTQAAEIESSAALIANSPADLADPQANIDAVDTGDKTPELLDPSTPPTLPGLGDYDPSTALFTDGVSPDLLGAPVIPFR